MPDIECYKCYSADKDDLELVYEAVINKPSLMNVGQLHDTYNPDLENSRWTLSFTLLNMDGCRAHSNKQQKFFRHQQMRKIFSVICPKEEDKRYFFKSKTQILKQY